jgi:tRNA threonylcarbamoyl adenosine modification protein YeaZ
MITAALDTSYGASLAISRDGRLVYQGTLPGGQREADRDLVPWVQAGLAKAEVEPGAVRGWVVGLGPGSFSGVRTGIALARGVCAVTGAVCRGVPSSAALALALTEQLAADESIGVLHDGRCGQVILSRYQWTGGVLQAVGDASAETPAYLVGPGLVCQRYVTIHGAMVLPLLPEAIRLVTTAVAAIEARCLLAVCGDEWPVAGALATASMEPVYVRPAVFVAPRPPVGLGRD